MPPFRTRWSLSTAQRYEVEARVAPVHSPSRGMLASDTDCERTRANAKGWKWRRVDAKEGWADCLLILLPSTFELCLLNSARETEREREIDWIHMSIKLFLTLTEFSKIFEWVLKKCFFKRIFKLLIFFDIQILRFLHFKKTSLLWFKNLKNFDIYLINNCNHINLSLQHRMQFNKRDPYNLRQLNIATDKRHACKYYSPCDCGEICYGWEVLLSENYRNGEKVRGLLLYVCSLVFVLYHIVRQWKKRGGWFTRVREVESRAYWIRKRV